MNNNELVKLLREAKAQVTLYNGSLAIRLKDAADELERAEPVCWISGEAARMCEHNECHAGVTSVKKAYRDGDDCIPLYRHPANAAVDATYLQMVDRIAELEDKASAVPDDTNRLDWWERNINYEHGTNYEDNTVVMFERTGNVNDRVWRVVAEGQNLRESIDAAMLAQQEGE